MKTYDMTDVGELNDLVSALREDHERRQMEMAELCSSLISRRAPEDRDLLWIDRDKYIRLHTSIHSLEEQLHDKEEIILQLKEQLLLSQMETGRVTMSLSKEYGEIVLEQKYKIRVLERKLEHCGKQYKGETLESRVYSIIDSEGFSGDAPWDIDLLVDILDQHGSEKVVEHIHEISKLFCSSVYSDSVTYGCLPEIPEDPVDLDEKK